mgnify:CR=1 FL=1
MYSLKSYKLLKKEYNYLLPVLRKNLSNSNDKYYFCGSTEELYDMIIRLKGLYNHFNENWNLIINYKCFKYGSLDPFREHFNNQ